MGNATGIIEVYGLVAAFVACDAGCKAADVTVEHFDKNKPGNPDSLTVPLIVAVKFRGTVDKEVRSLMNVPFVTESAELDAVVVKATKAAGYDNLKGHKSVGGLRASIYNAMPKEGVEALVEFLKKFEAENG